MVYEDPRNAVDQRRTIIFFSAASHVLQYVNLRIKALPFLYFLLKVWNYNRLL